MRYERQISMKQIGLEGQEKLRNAKVVVVGAGGLASPVLTYLSRAGVGNIKVIDYDLVSVTNLNRQFFYNESDIGKKKVFIAKSVLEQNNPDIKIIAIEEKLDKNNISDIIKGADVVVDCVDNIETRLAVNSICINLGIPLIEAGVNGFYGFVMAIKKESACIECMGYQNALLKSPIPALGAVVGVIGSLQAVECIKVILGIDGVLYGRMLNYDGVYSSFEVVGIPVNPNCTNH